MPTSAMQAFSELGDRLLATTTAIRGWAISASCWHSVGCPAVERLGGGGRGEPRVPGATLVVSVPVRLELPAWSRGRTPVAGLDDTTSPRSIIGSGAR